MATRSLHVTVPEAVKVFMDETFKAVTLKSGVVALLSVLMTAVQEDPTIVGDLLCNNVRLVRKNEPR